ncbi:MAG: response regulator [Candidatus Methylacidiphilales bacterium]|nr:response regulator [Candidatus Methylacidiphilales bacterium]
MEPKHLILLAEDNPDEAFITNRAFKSAGVPATIRHCEDGQAVIDYLESVAKSADLASGGLSSPLPRLLLLDLKMPRKNGLEVLRWVRQNEHFSLLIVLVLSSSAERQDILDAYRLHANAYLVKPSSLSVMTEMARSIGTFWLDQARLVTGLRPLA